jgi:hypothetical protein
VPIGRSISPITKADWEGTGVEPDVKVAAERCDFHHIESEDLFGIGFPLCGDAQFDMEGMKISTRPLDVWAGTGPRGSTSRFRLPKQGFRTVSLRCVLTRVPASLGYGELRRTDTSGITLKGVEGSKFPP